MIFSIALILYDIAIIKFEIYVLINQKKKIILIYQLNCYVLRKK